MNTLTNRWHMALSFVLVCCWLISSIEPSNAFSIVRSRMLSSGDLLIRVADATVQSPAVHECFVNPKLPQCLLELRNLREAASNSLLSGGMDRHFPRRTERKPICSVEAAVKHYISKNDAVGRFVELPQSKTCSATAAAINQANKVRKLFPSMTDGSRVLPVDEKLIAQYNESCFSTYEPEFSEVEWDQVAQRLVLLTDSNGAIQCHGFRLGHFVLTAQHCVSSVNYARHVTGAKFMAVDLFLEGGRYDNGVVVDNEDYALLKLSGETENHKELESWIGPPRSSGRIMLLQVGPYTQPPLLDVRQIDDLSSNTIRQDNPVCVLFGTRDGILLNNCQTEQGTSGMPYLQHDRSGVLRVVGVHSGPTIGLTERDEVAACAPRLFNFGVSLPIRRLLQSTKR